MELLLKSYLEMLLNIFETKNYEIFKISNFYNFFIALKSPFKDFMKLKILWNFLNLIAFKYAMKL
jgi:hypothetical protein